MISLSSLIPLDSFLYVSFDLKEKYSTSGTQVGARSQVDIAEILVHKGLKDLLSV
jgi:hypothetical protein